MYIDIHNVPSQSAPVVTSSGYYACGTCGAQIIPGMAHVCNIAQTNQQVHLAPFWCHGCGQVATGAHVCMTAKSSPVVDKQNEILVELRALNATMMCVLAALTEKR